MRKHSENFTYCNGQRHSKKSKLLFRSISTILCFVFVLGACVGCTAYASSDEVDTLNAALNDVDKELDSLKESYEAAQKEIEALKTDGEAAQQEITSLKNSNQAARQELDALEKSHQAAQDKIDTLTEGNSATKQENEALKGNHAAMQQELDSLMSSNESAQLEIEELKVQIEDLKVQIEELQNAMTPSEPVEKIKIYIDQGHNPTSYHNSGASGNGLYEQDLTFSIGILLAELLEEDGRFETCLSRPTSETVLGTDQTSSLAARVQGATDFGADYFISLHINSYTDSGVRGIEVLAAEQDSTSYAFGSSLLQGVVASTNLRNRGMKLRPDLYVLKNATMPAALVEMGFISNSDDAALLSQSPDLFARGVYEGILSYFGLSGNNASAT